jgi:uncharacterized repeat protein (TIGR01451 family)
MCSRALNLPLSGCHIAGSFRWPFSFAILVLSLFAGCSHLQLPAFDPSGSRIFAPGERTSLLTPNRGGGLLGLCRSRPSQPPAATFQPPPFSTAPLPAGPTPVPSPPLIGLGTGEPAFQHPPDPPPCEGSPKSHLVSFHRQKQLIPSPQGPKSAAQKGQLLMTPSKIIAPVGSEVVVLAGICGSDGFFVKNQPLEWMLSNDSVGQIIEVGGMQHATFNRIVPPTASKQSGQFAYGRTGLKNIVLTRGTPTPCDDIELKEGQTYISVSSISPGTSFITGYAPNAEGWDRRIASTVIHWVDGLWSIPAPSVATAGTVHPLTTVVSRTADAGGIAGWTVRYQIVGGAPAEFAPSGSQTAEAVTNKDGQATVQIRQIAGQFEPGTTQVRVDVIRPALFGQSELIVESGITTVTWSAPALTIRSIGPRTAGVNEAFNYRVEVSNPGDQIARDVVVRTKNLSESIEFVSANPKTTEFGRQLEWKLGDLPAGSPSRVIDVQFKSNKPGNVGLCFEVVSDSDRLRTEACSETEIALPCVGFGIDGPTVARVGETVNFRLNVTNQCPDPLQQVRMTIRLDQGLVMPGYSNPVTFELDQLQFNESRTFPLTILTQAAGTRCFDVEIAAQNGHTASARRCLEVGEQSLEQIRDQLGIQLQGATPISVGGTSLVIAKIANRGNTPLENVFINNRFAPSLEPVSITEGLRLQILADEILISIGRLNPQETREIRVLYRGLNKDANAVTEFTVSSPIGATANDKLSIRIEPAGVINPPGDEGRPIGIPGDPRPGDPADSGISIRFNVPQPTIPVYNPQAAIQSQIEVVVRNNLASPIRDVDITLNVPPGIQLSDFVPPDENLPLEKRNDEFTQFYLRRINEMRAGEEIRFSAVVVGRASGEHRFSVQVESLDTRGTIDSTPIRVSN